MDARNSGAPTAPNAGAENAPKMGRAPARPLKIRRKDIHDKWQMISDQEANGMKAKNDLVAMVQAKYGVNPWQAKNEVEAWVNGREF
jgi:hypothetical protein